MRHAPVFRTAITELFGIEHPILAGGLMWLSDAEMVASVVNAGGMGFITPRSYPTLDAFRADLERCWTLTDGRPFGVNLTLSSRIENNASLADQLQVALDMGVRHFETAGARPHELIAAIHRGGGVVIHKSSEIRHAQAAERAGADALALVGMEAGGHPGMNELPAHVMGAYALERLQRPLALGGGIGSGRQIASLIALGADAVVMGSRLVVAEEAWAHPAFKQRLLEVDERCSMTVMRSYGSTWRVLDNETAREVRRREAAGATYEELGDLARGRYGRDHAYERGDWNRGLLSMSSAIGSAKAIEPMRTIIGRLMQDAATAAARFDTRRSLAPSAIPETGG